MSLLSKFATVGGATLVSRIFGFGREMMMASALGVGPVADAFNLAFRFPNLFRRLFAEGAFNAAFIPLFARSLEEEGEAGARRFASEVYSTLFAVLVALTVVAMIFMPFLVKTIIAPGLAVCVDDPSAGGDVLSCAARYDLTVTLSRIMFPYLACMSLMAMVSGILNAFRRFFAAAAAPTLLNFVLIGVLVWCQYAGADKATIGFLMSWGVLFAGFAQLAMVVVAMRMAGFGVALRRPRWTKGLKRLLVLAGPAALIGGITQINLFVGQAVASFKPGAVSILQYADRPYQLPLGMVGIAIGVVLLPELARALKAGHLREAQHTQNRSLEFALFLTLPAAVALFIIPEPIIRVIYERGAFDPTATPAVAAVLGIFALGLPAFVMIKVFSPGYFAREDTRTPMYVTLFSAGVNIVLSLALFPLLAEQGIAWATTIAGWLNAGLLFAGLYRKGLWEVDRQLVKRSTLTLLCSLVMGAALIGAMLELDGWLRPDSPLATQILAIGILVASAMAIYFALALATGAADRRLLFAVLKRRRPAPPAAGPDEGSA
ncbi:murein biosynthesis integral membrane protein MurJ [Aurantimonas endophytica]|uniref:Probable lipid II flippase MurJ n=1 Tax=Aurantimonas endophytica TaxID=1522175 RepID=A0A7W6HHI2_9HYPH|nr:murein biosynthesis integral membrane protein MurJ [Aurantimonas endophytica]MBB4005304.1 putative peptidoglycan lipid II flippase [Aurantimonas endophytica]MCO6406034.1 murein biosynthesis integral membrane protein MurJ [Aurantimonas endophytica]